MKLNDEIKARLPKGMKKRLNSEARAESKRRGLPVSASDLAREAIAERLKGVAA